MAASVSLAPPVRRNTGVLVAATIGAVLLLLFGLLCLILYLAWPALETRSASTLITPDEAISQAAEFAALGVYGLGLGAGLLWQVVRAWRGVPGRRFRPARVAGVLALLLFPVALVLGVAALDLPHRAAGYLFPLPALLAVLTPPVLVISLVAQAGWGRGRTRRGAESPPPALLPAPAQVAGRVSREDPFAADLVRRIVGPPTGRRVLGAVAWGLAGASTIAVILEVVGAVVAVILLLVGLRLAGQGNLLTQGGDILGDSTALGCSAVQGFFANPLVPGGLILALGVAVPWIEEPAKSLAVVLLRNRLGTARDAFLYGVAAGVGFGMLESAIYNVGDVHTWWGTATLRLGTSFIHALATGLFGVAWFYRLQRRDRGRFWRYAFAGTAVHGLWNASVVVIITLSVFRICSTDPIALLTSTDPARYVAVLIPAVLWAGAALALVLLARRLGPAEPATGLTPLTGSADPARG